MDGVLSEASPAPPHTHKKGGGRQRDSVESCGENELRNAKVEEIRTVMKRIKRRKAINSDAIPMASVKRVINKVFNHWRDSATTEG